MMEWADVTENELQEKKEIQTDFGETLSWDYLCYVRENPVAWTIPTLHFIWRERLFDFQRNDIKICKTNECGTYCYEKWRALVPYGRTNEIS